MQEGLEMRGEEGGFAGKGGKRFGGDAGGEATGDFGTRGEGGGNEGEWDSWGEEAFHTDQGAGGAFAGGFFGDGEGAGDFGVGGILEEAEDEGFAVACGEEGEGAVDAGIEVVWLGGRA